MTYNPDNPTESIAKERALITKNRSYAIKQRHDQLAARLKAEIRAEFGPVNDAMRKKFRPVK